MTKPKEKPKAKPECVLCHGRGWFYAGHATSPWPTQCHRCFPPHPDVKGASNAQQQR